MCSNYFALRPRHCPGASRSRRLVQDLEAETLIGASGPGPLMGDFEVKTSCGGLEIEASHGDLKAKASPRGLGGPRDQGPAWGC